MIRKYGIFILKFLRGSGGGVILFARGVRESRLIKIFRLKIRKIYLIISEKLWRQNRWKNKKQRENNAISNGRP